MADPRFFKNTGPYTIESLILLTGAKLRRSSDATKKIQDIAPLSEAGSDDISFLDNRKYVDAFKASNAGACIVREEAVEHAPEDMVLLITDNPYHAYATVAGKFYPILASSQPPKEEHIASTAVIHESATIHQHCTIEHHAVIGPNAVIGEGCRIRAGAVLNEGVILGENCTINANVSISNAILGNRVIIHQGAAIGQDGFGYATHEGVHYKVPQLGRVLIEDDVEIGANTTIDRGSGPDTIIRSGVKIDNLVQIAHNVEIGRGAIIVSQVGIAGSTKIGNYCVLGGQVGIAGHITIGDGTQIAAQSGVSNTVKPGQRLFGTPAQPDREWHKQYAYLKRIVKQRGKKE